MESNKYKASRGWELDALQQIMSCCALSSHLLEKMCELDDNGDEDGKQQVAQLIELASTIRRQATAVIGPDTTYSCALKHACEVYQYATECCLASDEYPFELVAQSYKLLTGVISKALGHDLEFCGRCFWDDRLGNVDQLEVKEEESE